MMLCGVSGGFNSLGDILGLMSCKRSSENGQLLVRQKCCTIASSHRLLAMNPALQRLIRWPGPPHNGTRSRDSGGCAKEPKSN
jgi:hypothetical protein